MNTIEEINEALELNKNRTGDFENSDFTLGWIGAIVIRELNKRSV